jgi:hypothetical protein
MVGTLALFDAAGERQHTLYAAAAPEYGKPTFLERLARELDRVRAAHPTPPFLAWTTGPKVIGGS